MWVVLQYFDGVVVNALDYIDRSLDEAVESAASLAIENGYQHGADSAASIIRNESRLVFGKNAFQVVKLR